MSLFIRFLIIDDGALLSFNDPTNDKVIWGITEGSVSFSIALLSFGITFFFITFHHHR